MLYKNSKIHVPPEILLVRLYMYKHINALYGIHIRVYLVGESFNGGGMIIFLYEQILSYNIYSFTWLSLKSLCLVNTVLNPFHSYKHNTFLFWCGKLSHISVINWKFVGLPLLLTLMLRCKGIVS